MHEIPAFPVTLFLVVNIDILPVNDVIIMEFSKYAVSMCTNVFAETEYKIREILIIVVCSKRKAHP